MHCLVLGSLKEFPLAVLLQDQPHMTMLLSSLLHDDGLYKWEGWSLSPVGAIQLLSENLSQNNYMNKIPGDV